MDVYQELADDFISKRREYLHLRFEKEISTKHKNEIFVLSYLKKHNGAAHPKELSEEFMISTAQMAVILNQMEEKKRVVRLHDPESNRQTIVKLTEQGAAFFDRVNDEIIDFTAGLFRKIGEEDSRSFIRIMQKLMDAVAEENPAGETAVKTDHRERKSCMKNLQMRNQKAIRKGGNE